MENDVNQAFEDILFCEERIIENAYAQGFEAGQSQNNLEGYHLGYHRGAELGAELGYYLGVVQFHLTQHHTADKIQSHLVKLKTLIETFPKTNDASIDIFSKMDEIRMLFRKACSLLKINGNFPEADKMSF